MPLTERSGHGFITGGVIDETTDWLGSYNEGVQGAQQQTQNRLNIQGTRQQQALANQEEARRATKFGWESEDRAREAAAIEGSSVPELTPFAQPTGPGLLPSQNIPIPNMRPTTPGVDTSGGSVVDQMLPEWARMEQAVGLPNNYLETISMLESSGGTNTGNGKYVGVFQIGPEVAAEFGVTPEQLKDPRINSQIAAKLAARNMQGLRSALGRDPQPWELYLAHQQGMGGATALLKAPTQNVVDALAAAYGGDRTKAQRAVVQNGGNPQMTAGQFAALWQTKYAGGRPQPFTGQSGVSVAGLKATPEETAAMTQQSDPNATPLANSLVDMGALRRRNAYENILNQVRPGNAITSMIGGLTMSTEDYNKQQADDAYKLKVLKWYQSDEVKKAFEADPAGLVEAQKDPIAYYQQITGDGVTGVPQQSAGGKGDAPAGTTASIAKTGTQEAGLPVPAAPEATTPAPTQTPGLQTQQPEAAPAPEIQTTPGVDDGTQGTMAERIARGSALPSSGMYLVEPVRIQNEMTQLTALRENLVRRYERAKAMRDVNTMSAIEDQIIATNGGINLMQGLDMITKMQQGDDETFARTLSGITGGRARLQPRSDGKFNYYYDGQLAAQNVDREQIIAGLRMDFDKQYQAMVSKRAEQADALQLEQTKSRGRIDEAVFTQQAKMYSDFLVEKYKRENPSPNMQMEVADDGTITVLDKNTGGIRRLVPTPVMDPDGDPVLDGSGNPKFQLVDQNAKTTVPVQ